MLLGRYPTPVELLEVLSRPSSALWVKRDDVTHPTYGGNKVRKIERLLDEARARGADRIVTVGAVGSNYVLATGVFATPRGLRVEAVVVPQPDGPRVRDNLRADLAQGIALYPARSYAHAAYRVARRLGRGAYYVPAGGSNRVGVEAYRDAVRELAAQVTAGAMPEPDLVVVALGSGGTAAGIAAGLAAEGMRARVLGVTVAVPAWVVERQARAMAKRCAGREGAADAHARLQIDRGFLGEGYGHPTEAARNAVAEAAKGGLVLDTTYTAKAFAAALDRVAAGRDRTILYWHTLSSAPMAPLLAGAPELDAVDPALRALLRPAT